MPTTYKINNEFDSVNLLNRFSQFNEYYYWNKVTNPSGANVLNQPNVKFSGQNSCEINFANALPIEFNSGNDNMKFVALNTGLHTLRFSAFKSDSVSIMDFAIKCFVEGVNVSNTTFNTNLSTATGFKNNEWNSYWIEIYLIQDQTLDFSFVAQTNTPGTNLYFDGLKLSLRDRFLPNSVPFNEPLIKNYSTGFDVNLPLLQPGQVFVINQGEIRNSEIGDFIQMSIISPLPIQVNFEKLTFSKPYVNKKFNNSLLSTPENILFTVKNENAVAFQANQFTVKLLIQK